MSERQDFRDEELTAYLDEEADASLRDRIDLAKQSDSVLLARLQQLEIDRAQLRDAFGGLLGHAPEPPAFLSQQQTEQPAARRYIIGLAACAAVMMFVGVGIGWMASESRLQDWKTAAATYHMLYVEETLASVSIAPGEQSDQLARVSNALKREIRSDSLNGVAGLDYKRAQVLGYEGNPIVQLAFLTSDGVPIALCITKTGDPQTEVTASRYSGLNAVVWAKDGYEFIVLGDTSANRLLDFGRHFQSSL
ncbi:MAG: hypothetical protein RIC14_00605 [Filomicrobium sp.]